MFLVLVTNFSIDDVVSEIKTLYCKPNIGHLPAAVYQFGPVEAFFLSLSFTNNQLSSLLGISPFFLFLLPSFLPSLPSFLPFPSTTDSAIPLFSSKMFFYHQYVMKLHDSNCSSSMCLELRSSPERLHKIQCGESCFLPYIYYFFLNFPPHLRFCE